MSSHVLQSASKLDPIALVKTSSTLLALLWQQPSTKELQLTNFISHLLKRSKTCRLTLQLALYYLVRLSDTVYTRDTSSSIGNSTLRCPRRTFLICLILGGKYLFDRTYNLKSWSLISGLSVSELRTCEAEVLKALDYSLFVDESALAKWVTVLSFFCDICGFSNPSVSLVSWDTFFKNLNRDGKLRNDIDYVMLLKKNLLLRSYAAAGSSYSSKSIIDGCTGSDSNQRAASEDISVY